MQRISQTVTDRYFDAASIGSLEMVQRHVEYYFPHIRNLMRGVYCHEEKCNIAVIYWNCDKLESKFEAYFFKSISLHSNNKKCHPRMLVKKSCLESRLQLSSTRKLFPELLLD